MSCLVYLPQVIQDCLGGVIATGIAFAVQKTCCTREKTPKAQVGAGTSNKAPHLGVGASEMVLISCGVEFVEPCLATCECHALGRHVFV